MAKGFGARLANALAIGVGGLAEGYGKGSMQVALNAREEYKENLKAENAARAAAAERVYQEQQTLEEREWKEGQKEADREHDFEKIEKNQEFDLTLEEKKMANKIQLKGMGGGKAAKKPSQVQIANELAELGAAAEGREVTDVDRLRELKALTQKSGSNGRGSVPSSIKIADELAKRRAAAEGREVTEEDKLRELDKLTAKPSRAEKGGMTTAQYLSALNKKAESKLDVMNPSEYKKYRGNTEQARIDAKAELDAELQSMGVKPPGGGSRQKSMQEAKQPQSEEAPATSTKGDKPTDATPPGAGTQASPYMATTDAQQKWVLENAPSGALVSDGKRVFRKP